jgi:GH15 family glucan-1,4-alpha-glucosidase
MTVLQVVDHGFIGDGRAGALVASDGSIDWLCWPDFGGHALFSALTDPAHGGRFRIAPVGGFSSSQSYAEDSNVLVTRFRAPGGHLSLIDTMLLPTEEELRRRRVSEHQLIRRLSCDSGSVEVEIFYQPRVTEGTPLSLRGERVLEPMGDGAYARVVLRAGETLRYVLASELEPPPWLAGELDVAIQRTNAAWREIAGRCAYDGPYAAEVRRSLLALRLLGGTSGGSLVGAEIGWLRDAAMVTRALLELGFPDDASAFVRRSVTEAARDLESPAHLGALGATIDAVAHAARRGALSFDGELRSALLELGAAAARHWRGADLGVWETRGAKLQHTHSRVLCWVALDRMLDLGQRGLLAGVPVRFADERERIRRDVESRGFSMTQVTYTGALDGDRVDASLLLLAWYGYVQARAPRMRSTFQRLRERLTAGPALVMRAEDSNARGESPHAAASFWVAEHLARGGGPLAEADAWFKRLLSHGGGLGLYGEMIDAESGDPRGGFPHAFAHVALIGAALALEERRRKEISDEQPPVGGLGGDQTS